MLPTVKQGGLCCSQWHRGFFTARGKNRFNQTSANTGSKHHTTCKKAEDKRKSHLQQANDPKHMSKSTMDYLKRCKVKVLPLSSQPKHHQKSVDRPQKGSVCKLGRESKRTRRLLKGGMSEYPLSVST